jgi:hypothetical protein
MQQKKQFLVKRASGVIVSGKNKVRRARALLLIRAADFAYLI